MPVFVILLSLYSLSTIRIGYVISSLLQKRDTTFGHGRRLSLKTLCVRFITPCGQKRPFKNKFPLWPENTRRAYRKKKKSGKDTIAPLALPQKHLPQLIDRNQNSDKDPCPRTYPNPPLCFSARTTFSHAWWRCSVSQWQRLVFWRYNAFTRVWCDPPTRSLYA